ncbi:MAG: cysteine desulfurase family protein, partial [Acutalibacter sp.]
MEHYLDNSATTQVLRPVAERALELMVEEYGNPSSLHTRGFRARQRVEEARALVAQRLGAQAEEITFTSGGTEANNLALFGAAQARKRLGNKIVTTAAEHDSVLNPCREMEKLGFEVVYVKPDSSGHLPSEALAAAIDQNTILVSCMLVNNETGAIFPVEEAARAIRRSKAPALLHVDAVQAFGKLPFTVKKLGADLLTLSGHKLHAPKGVGALYVKKTTRLLPRTLGGGQERGLRSGTENVPLI